MKNLLVPILLALTPAMHAGEFHVSPTGSDAAGNGSAQKPFGTLEKARDAARADKGSKIILAAGFHRRIKTLELDARDSGTVFTGKKASIVGSVAIPNSAVKPVTDAAILARLLPEVRGKVLEADLHALGVTDFGDVGPRGFRRPYIAAPLELIVDGKALDIARWPDAGQPGEKMGRIIDKGPISRNGEKPTRGGIFEFKTDRPTRWTQADDIWITGLFENGYADNTVKVQAFDLEKKTLTTVHSHMYGFGGGNSWNRWTALNLLEEISVPGEYMADRKSGKLYFLPPAGVDVSKAKLEVTMLREPLVALEGAKGVVFDGVNFANARGMGVYIEGGENCRIQNATLNNFGMLAICIGKGISADPDYRHAFTGTPVSRELGSWHEHIYNNTTFNREAGTGHGVVNCSIFDIGAGAISLGGGDRKSLTSAGNFVENCDIHHFNRWDRTYKAGVNIDGVGNRILHCKIHDCPGSAIYLHGNDHLIEFNEVHHALTDADDMGAFYMGRDASERGNILRHNFWHDLARQHNTFALHFDDAGGDGTLVQGNIFLRAGRLATVNFFGGSDVTITDNIFIDCPIILWMTPNCPHRNGIFKQRFKEVGYDSPVWVARYPGFSNFFKEISTMPRNDLFERNIFVGTPTVKNGMFGKDAKGIVFRNNLETADRSFFTEATPGQPVFKTDTGANLPDFKPIPFGRIAGLDGKPVGKPE